MLVPVPESSDLQMSLSDMSVNDCLILAYYVSESSLARMHSNTL